MEKYILKELSTELIARIFLKTNLVTFFRIMRTNKFISQLTNNMRLRPHMHCSKVSVSRSNSSRDGYKILCILESSTNGTEIDITHNERLIRHVRTWNFRVNACPMYIAEPLCAILAPLTTPSQLKHRKDQDPSQKRKEPRLESRLKTGSLRVEVFLLFFKTLKPTLIFHACRNFGDRSSPQNLHDWFFRLNDPLVKRLRNIRIEDLYLKNSSLKMLNTYLKAWSTGRILLDFLRIQHIIGRFTTPLADVIEDLTDGMACQQIWTYDTHESSAISAVPKKKLDALKHVVIFQVDGIRNKALLAVSGVDRHLHNISVTFFIMQPNSHLAVELAVYLGYMSPGEDEKLRDYFEYMLKFWRV